MMFSFNLSFTQFRQKSSKTSFGKAAFRCLRDCAALVNVPPMRYPADERYGG
jgi:hypothetical protein